MVKTKALTVNELPEGVEADELGNQASRDLEVLKNVISGNPVNSSVARQAVDRAIGQYDARFRLFQVGMANAKIEKVLSYMKKLEEVDNRILEESIEDMTPGELLRLQQVFQERINTDLSYVDKVIEQSSKLGKIEISVHMNDLQKQKASDEKASELPPLEDREALELQRLLADIRMHSRKESKKDD